MKTNSCYLCGKQYNGTTFSLDENRIVCVEHYRAEDDKHKSISGHLIEKEIGFFGQWNGLAGTDRMIN